MNPATPGPLTVLLVPPAGDAALLADECGGRVPTMYLDTVAGAQRPCPVCGSPTRWWSAPTEQYDSCYICTADPGHAFPQSAVTVMGWRMGSHRDAPRALLLVHEGTPVAMGCDRAVRWVNAGERARLQVQLDYDDPAYIQVILHEAVKLGACVVLLRDGREVGS